MKKKLLGLLICITLLVSTAIMASAAEPVIENPNLKIVIDGKTGTYADVPVIYKDRSMLPLRALLVNLGVKNDEQHILWNSKERSITINHEVENEGKKVSVKIYLKIDSETAYVNNTPITLDAAPIIYKDKTYIPTRFVAQSLGKKVAWDGVTSSVLIRDEKEYKQVKSIMDKSDMAMDAVAKATISVEKKMTTVVNGQSSDAMAIGTVKMDRAKQLLSMWMTVNNRGQKTDSELYLANNYMYASDPMTRKWVKNALPESVFKDIFGNIDQAALLQDNEVMYAGLVIDQKYSATNDILLKGNIYPEQRIKMAGILMMNSETKTEFEKIYVEIYIDKATSMINKIYVDADLKASAKNQQVKQNQKMTVSYNYSNIDFEVIVPEDALKNAVEYKR